MDDLKFITKILHSKFAKEDPYGSIHMPVYDSVAFEFKTSEEIQLAFERKKPAHVYSRSSNPTVENFEQKIKAVTDAAGVLALSSGMAAIVNIILSVVSQGENIVTSKHLFGNTYSLFTNTLDSWGLETRYTDLTQVDRVDSLLDEKTRAIFFETVTNPQLEIADIATLAKLAKDKDVLLIADTTLTPPYVLKSRDFGVDIEILASTKIISGGATSMGGLIIDNGTYDWNKNPKIAKEIGQTGQTAYMNYLRRKVFRNLGSCQSPHNAYLQSLGLETLPLRIEAACANTHKIAEFLHSHSKINNIHYPGLKSSRFHDIGRKQFGNKPGSLLTFDLASKGQCFAFMDALKLIKRATNFNDNRTLVLHPASTIFVEYEQDLREKMGIPETMIRLSVGIEDPGDLKADLIQALDQI